jgi:hypothetical protein
MIEAGLEAQIDYLNEEERQALGERLAGRFGWQTAGSLVVAQTAEFTLARDDYDLTVTALGDLGVKNTRKNKKIPEFDEVAAAFSPATATYLGEHVERGDQPELTFHVPLAARYDMYKVVENFDRGQQYDTSIWRALWDNFSNNDHNQGETNLSAAVLLNDTTKPKDREQPANEYNEAGLVHANHTVPEQRSAIKREQGAAKAAGVELNPISVTQYLVTQAKRRQAGQPLLDRPTVTRFVQYPDKNIGGIVCVPNADVRGDDRLRLNGSRVGDQWGYDGVRRVVRVA